MTSAGGFRVLGPPWGRLGGKRALGAPYFVPLNFGEFVFHALRCIASAIDRETLFAYNTFLFMFKQLTERGREVLKLALTEASHFNHEHIDPAHLLVGLLREERGVAARALAASGVTLEGVRERLGAILGHGEEDTGGKPFTPRSKKVLDLALGAARRLGDERVDTEHLLLALASEPEGAAAEILADLGVTQREIRAGVVSLIGKEDRTGIASEGLTEQDSTGTLWVPGNGDLDLDRPVPAP